MTEDTPAILLVEDEPLIRLVLAELLEDAGFRVIEAAQATEAFTILDSGLPVSVLLTDVDMPCGGNGYDLARSAHESWPHLEILVMSGRQWPAQGDLPPGAAFLAKPCPNEAIVSHVRSAVERALKVSEQQEEFGPAVNSVVPFPRFA